MSNSLGFDYLAYDLCHHHDSGHGALHELSGLETQSSHGFRHIQACYFANWHLVQPESHFWQPRLHVPECVIHSDAQGMLKTDAIHLVFAGE